MFGWFKKKAPVVVKEKFPFPFVRRVKPVEGYPGWYEHDGGECPVLPDTLCAVPSGTYYSKDGLMRFRARDETWSDRSYSHLRDEIDNFCVVDQLPEKKENI